MPQEDSAKPGLLCFEQVAYHVSVSEDQGDMILILAKAAQLPWRTARALLLLRAGDGVSAHDLEKAQENYSILKVGTASQVITFYRQREELLN